MINRNHTPRVSLAKIGSSQQGLPVAATLLVLGIFLILNQLAPRSPWVAPRWERTGPVPKFQDLGSWGAVLDPHGWEESLQHDLAYLLASQESEIPAGGTVLLGKPGKQISVQSTYQGWPRAELWVSTDFLVARAELYDRRSGQRLLSGPVEGRVSGPYIGDPTDGLKLDALRFLPRETERVVWLDTNSFKIPEEHRKALRAAWGRWEFQPTEALTAAFSSPFCYAVWRGRSVFLFGLESREKIETEIAHRFPRVVMKKTTGWAAGSEISGFGRKENAAWFYRGDYFVVSPSGGVEGLKEFLNSRFQETYGFRDRDAIIEELQRVIQTDKKGWHVCIIERRPEKALHWALLLRIDEGGQLNGYLVAEPRSTNLAKDATR